MTNSRVAPAGMPPRAIESNRIGPRPHTTHALAPATSRPDTLMKPTHLTSILSVLVLALAAAGCGPASAESTTTTAPAGASAPPPPTVRVAPAAEIPVADTIELTGRVRAVGDVEVRARVSGHLEKVHFENGALVKAGDLLVTLDPRWYQATLASAEAALAQGRVRVENAEREASRAEQLLAKQAISAEESEGRKARLAEAKAAVLSAEAAVTAARLDLEYTQVRAPIDGRVDRAFVTEGNFVSGIPSANTVLTTIVSVDPVYVDVDLDEVNLLRLQHALDARELPTDAKGRARVELGLSDDTGFPRIGHVESLGNRVDPATGSIRVRIVVENADKKLLPGMFVRVRLPLSKATPRVMIGERAIGTDQSQKFVLVVGADDVVGYRPVQIGAQVGNDRVITKGLSPGERVILDVLMMRAPPGAKVVPTTGDAPAAPH